MPRHDFLFDKVLLQCFAPAADRFAGGISSDVFSLQNYRLATFFVLTGAIEDANISNIVTVDACDDTTPTTTVAMAFSRRVHQWSTTDAAWGALASVAAAGYNFATANAVANAVWMIEVTADEVEAAAAGYEYVRLTIAETANKTITAGAFVILSEPRYPGSIPVQA